MSRHIPKEADTPGRRVNLGSGTLRNNTSSGNRGRSIGNSRVEIEVAGGSSMASRPLRASPPSRHGLRGKVRTEKRSGSFSPPTEEGLKEQRTDIGNENPLLQGVVNQISEVRLEEPALQSALTSPAQGSSDSASSPSSSLTFGISATT